MNSAQPAAQRVPPRGPSRFSRGGISKRGPNTRLKVDKDGDLDMDASPNSGRGRGRRGDLSARGGPASRGGPSGHLDMRRGDTKVRGASGSGVMRGGTPRMHLRSGQGLVEIAVLGWKESRGTRDGVIEFLNRKAGTVIKKSRTDGETLYISVPYLQSPSFLQLDNVLFAGSKLSLAAQNAPKLMSKREESMIAMATPESKEKTETIQLLETFLASRYNKDAKMLDLSRLGEDPILRTNGFFNLASTTSKMFPAMMLVADRRFETPKEKREAVHSISLAYNNLKEIKVISTLALTFPELKNLSLEGNEIPSWRELDNWRHKFRKLEQLVLVGNPIVATEGYKEEAMRRYPCLQMLDYVVLDRPVIKGGASGSSQGSIDTPSIPLPLPTRGGCIIDENNIGMGFLNQFFSLYDADRNNLLASFYDDSSVFSVSANTQGPRIHQQNVVIPPKPWEPYYAASRNLARVHNTNTQLTKLFIGRDRIRSAWNDLPQTKHDVTDSNLWVFDVWPVQGLPDVTNLNNTEGVVGLMVVVHGEFEEIPNHANVVPLKRSFDRTFTLGPGGGPLNMRVINDIMVIRPWSGSDAWRPEPENTTILSTPNPVRKSVVSQPAGNSPNQHVIIEVGRRTGLNMRYAQLALEENNWNFEAALKAIEAAKANLPPDAYTPVQL